MWWLIFPAIIILFLAVVLIRTAAFKPKKSAEAEVFDGRWTAARQPSTCKG